MTNTPRTWLIAALTHQKLPTLAEQQVAEHFGKLSVPLVEAANNDGVITLLEHRLAGHPDSTTVPPDLLSQIQQAAKQGLMDQLPFFA